MIEKKGRSCDQVDNLTLATNYHHKNKLFFQEPLLCCLLCTWKLVLFSSICRSVQLPCTPNHPIGTHQSSVSVSIEQSVALIDYAVEFWYRRRKGARKATLGVSARITFGLMLCSKWLLKCCVVILMNSCVTMLCFVQPTIQLIVCSKNWNIRGFYVIMDGDITPLENFLQKCSMG